MSPLDNVYISLWSHQGTNRMHMHLWEKPVISIYKYTICVEWFELVLKEVHHILRFIYVYVFYSSGLSGHIKFSSEGVIVV